MKEVQKHLKLQGHVHYTHTCFQIRIFFYQKSGIVLKEFGIMNQLVKMIRYFKCVCPSRKKATEFKTCTNSLKNKSLSGGSTQEAERACISPSNSFPLPKANTAVKMARSARRCDIVICSPFKNSLLNTTNKKWSEKLN